MLSRSAHTGREEAAPPMTSNSAPGEINGLPVRINRASPIWQQAIEETDPAVLQPDGHLWFTFWDTFDRSAPDLSECPADARVLKLVPRTASNPLANKKLLARELIQRGLTEHAPATFETIDDAIAHPDRVDIWFLKNPLGTAGRGMFCVSSDALGGTTLPDNYIVQAGVEDLQLIEGRKFTARLYVVIADGAAYLYDNGFLVIHAPIYDPSSTDYSVQIDHAGYERADAGVKLLAFRRYQYYDKFYARSLGLLQDIAGLFDDVVQASDESTYLILGVDLIFQASGEVKMLEINNAPNFVHTPAINAGVNVPLFKSVLMRLMGNTVDGFTRL